MEWKSIFFTFITFVIGALVGAGLTKNKYIAGIILSYVVMMILFRLFRNKIISVKEATDKKLAMRNEAVKTWNEYVDQTEDGNAVGRDLFDKYYPEYIFYFNVIIFISIFVLLFMKLWIWSLVCFLGLHVIVVLNQIYRNTKKKEVRIGEVVENEDK